ncbi:hypothetical protein FOZ61_010842 [Perkinsus olseni]|uniref:subtilisin n=1 Tax=Perkinsus olseni TaxID=32597 RepID=A0A7J6LUP3_PEROL|nr:hypothetical protein FOZ61_010842 [Perkinsus olseni]KAF4662700.1 hypothetical protein FOL46_005188 [Perkinsus olseni]
MPRSPSVFLLSVVLIILPHPAILTAQPDTAVVLIEGSNGNPVGIGDAFYRHRNVLGQLGYPQERLDRLAMCFRVSKESTAIENLGTIGAQIVHGGGPDCPASVVEICALVEDITPYVDYRELSCTDGSQLSSPALSTGRADGSVTAGAILRAHQNVLRYPPNDPLFPRQKRFFQALRIEETWEAVRQSGLPRKDVIVSLVDDGVPGGHPELKGKLLKGYDVGGAKNKSLLVKSGHGTAMAGIIAANINNGIGIAGIADKVKLRPIDDVNPITGKATLSMTMRALEATLRFKKNDVILFAAGYPYGQKTALLFKRVLEKAVKKGILFLTAVSNKDDADGMEELLLPCSLANGIPGVLCIAATTAKNPFVLSRNSSRLASFGAPGTDVWLPTRKRDGDDWIYKNRKGASAAAAAVAGIVALMKSFKNFKPRDVERILLNCTEGRVRTENGAEMFYGVLRPDLAVSQAIAEAR